MSAEMCISTLPSEVMCGVTSSCKRASTNRVETPAAETWLNGIADDYEFMEPALVELLREKMREHFLELA